MFPFITILEGGKKGKENKSWEIKATDIQSLMSSCQSKLAADLSFQGGKKTLIQFQWENTVMIFKRFQTTMMSKLSLCKFFRCEILQATFQTHTSEDSNISPALFIPP